MRHIFLTAFLLLSACIPLRAQTAPLVGTTVRTTDTSATSVRVGCTQAGSCTGGVVAGPVDVSSVTSAGFIGIANNVPSVVAMRLYNNAGTLTWNGVALATGSSLSGTLNTIPVFTGVSSVGNSIMTQSGASITVTGDLTSSGLLTGSGGIVGTINTTSQNLITTMSGLTTASSLNTVGTIISGTWTGSIIGLSVGGTGANLSATGGTSQFLRQNSVGGAIAPVRPAVADLSDSATVPLLNVQNTFTVASQQLQPNTTTNSAIWQFINTGGTSWVGADSSIGALGSGAPYSLLLLGGTTGGIALRANNAAGALRIYTGGGNLRWGVNAAGDWTVGTSANIADSNGTPVIASGFGTSPSIAGTDYAFRVTNGTPPADGIVTFGHTFAAAPVCTVSLALASNLPSAQTVAAVSTTTGVTINHSASGDAAGKISVLCRGF